MKQPSQVAIVILNWNGKRFLEQFLPSVMRTSYGHFEVIVADNASTDDSVAWLRQTYPAIRIIQLDRNYGFAKGYNEALKQVKADYYILLNSDVEVTPGWLDPMVALLDTNPGVAACQPKILSWHNKTQFEYAGAAGGWMDHLGYPFSRGRIFDVCETDHGQYDESEPIFWASGAALFIRSSIFHEQHGFDEYFFAHMEEIDLCWRIQLSGKEIWATPASVVYHVGGGTLPKGNSRKVFLNFRNNHIMLAKNLPVLRAIWLIPFRFCLDGITALKGLLSGDAGQFAAIIKGHFAFINWLFFHQRKSVFQVGRQGKLRGYLAKSVVWQHFVKKKNSFAEIIGAKD